MFLISFSTHLNASTKCPAEQQELKAVQKQMKEYGVTEYLRTKERRAFIVYDNCRKGKNRKKDKKNKLNNEIKTDTNKNAYKYRSNSKFVRKGEFTSSVKFRSKFKGQKQEEWLEFYRIHRPKECAKPSSTVQFSKCVEYRNKAAKYFERLWRQQNPDKEAPPSIKLGTG